MGNSPLKVNLDSKGKKEKKPFRNTMTILSVAPLYLFTFLFIFGPLLYMVFISFMSRSSGFGIAFIPTLENYKNIFEPIYLKTFWESFKLAIISTSLIILIGYPFGYFMGKLKEKNRSKIMTLLTLPFGTNSLLRLYGWVIVFRSNGILDKLLMGLRVTSEPMKLMYSYPMVVVGMIYALLPFMIFSVFSSVENMDWSLVEAARDLGASAPKAFTTITLKLTLPGLLSGIVLTFIPSMGLFFIADILGGNKIVLIGSLIEQQINQAHNIPFAAALAVFLTILTTVVIRLYQKLAKVDDLEGLV